MAKNMKRIVLMLWVIALCVSTLGLAVRAANDPVSATIQVNIAVSGDSPDPPDTFLVEMTPDETSFPMPQGTKDGVYTLSLVGASPGEIRLSFDRVGEYRYTLRQLPGTNGDCRQDTGVYHITARVTVGNSDRSLQLSVVLSREGNTGKQDAVVFQNRYPDPTQITLGATTTLDNETPRTGQFSFQLKDETGKVLETVKNNGRSVDFQTIPYESVGTYTYTMLQVIGGDPNIIYDESQYTVTVTVEEDADGNHRAKVVYRLGDKEVDGIPHFANRTKTDVPQTGDSSNLGLWTALLLLSGFSLLLIWLLGKRKRKDDREEAFATEIPTVNDTNA